MLWRYAPVAGRSTDLHALAADPEPVLSPREGLFDSRLVEPGPPPLLTDEGILLIYNAARMARYALCRWIRRV